MKYTAAAALLLFLTRLTQAIIIPHDHPEGLFIGNHHEDGTFNSTPVHLPNSRSNAGPSSVKNSARNADGNLHKRAVTNSCLEPTLTQSDALAVEKSFGDACDQAGTVNWISPRSVAYAITGGTIAYMCNFDSGAGSWCTSGGLYYDINNNGCPMFSSSETFHPDPHKAWAYGIAYKGITDFCQDLPFMT
ncbi:hypothetical protein LTR56_019309 [Elasticomyces elasticus]|nr:hypothetical protein LTR56_019309 [Elasticomyces elasticus]KAK3635322.1 hypothetical protein LTR22_019250 [Elasticomyces elasticus]KAK5749485.1 hypothetical protein LTS12_020478 [Elasticomyces elasticus]